MRVISGEARGRPLRAPKNQSKTRPMADKIKEAAFSSMESLGVFPDRVLDLYAGSGAVGIEALSRWATQADFVDRDRTACQTIRQNLSHTGFADNGQVHQLSADVFLGRVREPYDMVILDPPYADPDIIEVIERISNSNAVTQGTILLLGHWPRLEIPERIGRFETLRQRCHGDSCFAIFEWNDETGEVRED
ncbi:MAG: RsmD family RNA methyltransferase [Thermomicrobiales bacterium]